MHGNGLMPSITVDILSQDDLLLDEEFTLLETECVDESDGRAELEGVSVLSGDENSINGEAMLLKSRGSGKLAGLRSAKAFVRQQSSAAINNPHEIMMIFCGTVAEAQNGLRYSPCVGWDGSRWCRGWSWLGGAYHTGSLYIRYK